MKKFLALILTLVMILSLSVTAFAAGTPSEAVTFTFNKDYKTTNGEDPATEPNETLTFEVEAVAGNPDDTPITIANQPSAGGLITVNVPSYSKVGKWNYTISEVAGNTQGVTYSSATFNVQVFVARDAIDEDKLVATTSFTTVTGDTKVDTIVNNYDLGSLTVSKEVTGNLGSKNQAFDIDVTFTATKDVLTDITYNGDQKILASEFTGDHKATVTIALKDGDSCTFTNIPAGITYTVEEDGKYQEADSASMSDPAKGYTVSYTGKTGTITADGTAIATVTNNKEATIDTGITLDSLPYVLLMAVAVLGMVAFVMKKRAEREY